MSSPERSLSLALASVVLGAVVSGLPAQSSSGTRPYPGTGSRPVHLARDIVPGSGGSSPEDITALGKRVVFSAEARNSDRELWVSDGTRQGTTLVRDIWPGSRGSAPAFLVELDGRVLFRAASPTVGIELWVTDGTFSGTRPLDVRAGVAGIDPRDIARVGNLLFFSATDGVSGFEPWVSDGTVGGTRRIADIWTGPGSSHPTDFAGYEGEVVFSAEHQNGDRELWITDGTPNGTSRLRDLEPGAVGGFPRFMTAYAGKVYFNARGTLRANGPDLWVTNFTTAGTRLLVAGDLRQGPYAPRSFVRQGGALFFVASSQAAGTEIWVTDGTATGTRFAFDTFTGAPASGPECLTAVGSRRLYCQGQTPRNGRELVEIRLDRGLGNIGHSDIRIGTMGSNPANGNRLAGMVRPFAVAGDKLFFRADDGVHGGELWVAENGATAQPVAQECSRSRLRADDPTIGSIGYWESTTEVPNALNLVLLGVPNARPAPVPFFDGCRSRVDLFTAVPPRPPAIGRRHWGILATPIDWNLVGAQFVLQGLHSSTTHPGVAEVSNPVVLTLGI